MLHSGSRGIGNRIGTHFIAKAREALERRQLTRPLPDRDLAWLEEGEPLFDDYVEAVGWAQDYARHNREVMMAAVLRVMREQLPPVPDGRSRPSTATTTTSSASSHFGEHVWVTRKGAVRAGDGELGIIPGSMGAKSYIVRGKGNAESFQLVLARRRAGACRAARPSGASRSRIMPRRRTASSAARTPA